MKYLLIPIFILFALSAAAQSTEEDIIAQLEASGFTLVDQSKSWLGRIILEFESETREREIILNPVNGEIIRDYSEARHENEDGERAENWWSHLFGGDGE